VLFWSVVFGANGGRDGRGGGIADRMFCCAGVCQVIAGSARMRLSALM
jgi:hypothetical protein